jgi:AcrR family transcriptional regulator
MTEQETFTTRLRRHRERNRIALADISRDTRVKLELLEALERNDLSGWPRGLYARAYVRAYAAAIGLDGDDTVNEFCRLFPHGDRRVESVIREIADIVASRSEFKYDYRYASDTDRRNSAPPLPPARRHPLEGALSRLRSWIGAIGRSPARDARSAPRNF